MRRFFVQHQNLLICLTGCFLIPVMLACALLYTGTGEKNITGLLNEPSLRPAALAGAVFMLGWLLFMLNTIAAEKPVHQRIPALLLLAVLILAALCLPWLGQGNILSDIHIAASYAAFVYMNVLFYSWCGLYETEKKIYICLFTTAFLISAASGEVKGISEVLYAAGVSILITRIALKNG